MNEASNRSTAAPWAWRPSKNAWFRGLLVPITAWRPDPALELDGSALVRRLCEAAEGNEEWLFHPLINPLVLAHGQRLSSDFQLAVWIAGHSSTSLGSVRVPQPLWTWSPDGGVAVPPGRHDLDSLASVTAKSSWPFDIALDVWADSIGFPYPTNFSYPNDWSWSAHRPLSDAHRGRLETEVRIFMSAVNGLSSALPECIEWTATVTRVVVPLCRDVDTKFKSGSRTDLPGVVFFDLHGGAHQICEALVHESAHQHLCIEEAAGPLVEPAHQGTYSSPLRPDPRPLRGILLAYHALVYMCLYYAECIGRGIGNGQEDELAGLRRKADDGERVLADNARNLTPAGVAFFERTREVRRHVVA